MDSWLAPRPPPRPGYPLPISRQPRPRRGSFAAGTPARWRTRSDGRGDIQGTSSSSSGCSTPTPAATLERALETCVLQLPIVWQHRVKVAWQARLVRRGLNGDGAVRVLSIGCGGARDLLLLEPHELRRLEVVLNDLDPDALALAEARLSVTVRSLTGIRGNALRSTARLRVAGPFDVILVGGLLDYLPEDAARTLLQHAGQMLKPGGLLGATNIAAANPWRQMLHLLTSWTLIERSHEEMTGLFRASKLKASIALDESGLTWLAAASNP